MKPVQRRQRRRAFTLIELLVVISIIALLIGMLLPAIGGATNGGQIAISMDNLRNFGAAHALYAGEWNGRQWTTCPDDFTVRLIQEYGGPSYQNGARPNRYPYPDSYPEHVAPPVPLGFDRNGTHHQTSAHQFIVPMWDPGNCSLGSFRAFHTKPFNQYINGKVYDPIFWGPKDYVTDEKIHQWRDDPGEWPVEADYLFKSTYCTSVAAMVSPVVYKAHHETRRKHGAKQYAAGHRSPNLSAARYPDLKTHMLEHYWLQNTPSTDIPNAPGVPWFYNMGADSTPATLFYDSSVRMMSVREAVQSDRRVQSQGEPSLVACDACFGCGGYFENHAYGGDRSAINSYHVFTRDGILGRDTTGGR